MPGTIARLNAALSWDLDDFDRGTGHIESVFGKLRGLVAGVAVAFESAGRRMTLGITAPLLGLATYTVKAASDATELQSAFDATFGAMSGRMNQWAEDTGNAMGRATQEMQEGALALGGLFNEAAATGTEAAKLSQRFTELAQDASSFFNVDFETALQKIRSGLTGEAEPLRAFNIFLNETAVNAQGLKMGLISAGEELNENGKIMARAALIAEGLSTAQGDVVRTSDSLANQIRALMGEIRELATEMGERLEPVATRLVSWIRSAVQWFKELPDWVKDAAVKFAVFAAAMGPVMLVIGHLAAFVLPLFLANAGPVFFLISAFINPLGTAVVFLAKFALSWELLAAIMARIGPLFLRLTGPIGLAVTAILLFKDSIIDALGKVLDKARSALGPRLEALFSRLGEMLQSIMRGFDALAASPIGQFISGIIDLLGQLVGWLIEVGGTAVIRAISAVIDLINDVLEVLMRTSAVIQLVLKGEWQDAWSLAGNTVETAVARMARSIASLIPGLNLVIKMLEAAGLIDARSGPQSSSQGGIEADIAKIRGKADAEEAKRGKGIGRKYSVDELAALGALEDPDSATKGDYALPSKPKKGARGRGRSGPSQQELANRREQIRLEQALTVAREKGDQDAVRALERKRDLQDRIERYERAGLSSAQAKSAASKDILEIDEARAVAQEKAIAGQERQIDMKLAELRGDYAHLRFMEDEEFIERQTLMWQREGLKLAEAEKRAQQDLVWLEEARGEAAQRRLADQEAAHEIELARMRGDSASSIRAMEEADRQRRRAEELEADFGLSRGEAVGQATREGLEREKAHMTGTFRDTFRSGLRAAMDGDLGGFFENWMKDRSFNALADVLDRLATSLTDLIFGARQGGGGFLSSILGIGSAVAGGGGGGGGGDITVTRGKSGLIGFDSGGSFKIAGFPGIDQNTLSLNGNPVARVSQGEILDVRKGDRGAGGGGNTYNFSGNLMTPEFWNRIQAGDAAAADAGGHLGVQRVTQRGAWRLG